MDIKKFPAFIIIDISLIRYPLSHFPRHFKRTLTDIKIDNRFIPKRFPREIRRD